MSKEAKWLTRDNVPKSYTNHITSRVILMNLYKFINYYFEGDKAKFLKFYRSLLMNKKNIKLNCDEADSKIRGFRAKLNGVSDRRLLINDATDLSKHFSLPEDSFLMSQPKKEVAYIIVECSPSKLRGVFEKLAPSHDNIIDECSALTGDADIFLRLYGTRQEISDFIFNDIGNLGEGAIKKTRTHFSMMKDVIQKYPIVENTARKPLRPIWIPKGWQLPQVKSIS